MIFKKPPRSEKRVHRRYNIDLLRLWGVIADDETPLHDISEGGVSFYSKKAFESGSTVTFGGLQIDVVGCSSLPQANSQAGAQFMVRARFADQLDEEQVNSFLRQQQSGGFQELVE